MAKVTLVIGQSGTGKSTSIRNLDEKETFIINVLDKPLPFKGFNKKYVRASKDNLNGNYSSGDDYLSIIKFIRYVDKSMPQIKNVIVDDFQYVMANEFMRRASEKGFDKFTEIAQHAWKIIEAATLSRDDLFFFFLSHSEEDLSGRMKCKTIGKMLDDKITLEGMFTTVLHSMVYDGKYKFLTQNSSNCIAKSPMGMFDEISIENDLLFVKSKMKEYYGEEALA